MVDLPKCRVTTWAEADALGRPDRGGGPRGGARSPRRWSALTRGGWVPARMLADRLGVKRLVSIRLQHWGVTAPAEREGRAHRGPERPGPGQRRPRRRRHHRHGREPRARDPGGPGRRGPAASNRPPASTSRHSKFVPDVLRRADPARRLGVGRLPVELLGGRPPPRPASARRGEGRRRGARPPPRTDRARPPGRATSGADRPDGRRVVPATNGPRRPLDGFGSGRRVRTLRPRTGRPRCRPPRRASPGSADLPGTGRTPRRR